MRSGIFLSFTAVSGLSEGARAEIMNYVNSEVWADQNWGNVDEDINTADDAAIVSEAVDETEEDEQEEEPADLSLAQVRKMLQRAGIKTRGALRAIAEAKPSEFKAGEIAKALKVGEADLRGTWAAITKVTRTVLGDKDAFLIKWNQDEATEKWTAQVSEMTHRSLQKAFQI